MKWGMARLWQAVGAFIEKSFSKTVTSSGSNCMAEKERVSSDF